MRNNFITSGLTIGVSRNKQTNELTLSINSEYSRSQHKGQLHVNEKKLSEEIEQLWKSIKTKKLQKMSVSFDEIDWYDDMTDVYETPYVHIERGQKKCRIGHNEHGSIPKDWEIYLRCRFTDTTTSTPLIEVVKKTLGSYFTPKLEKDFKKILKPILQKKKEYGSVENPWEERTMSSSSFWY